MLNSYKAMHADVLHCVLIWSVIVAVETVVADIGIAVAAFFA